MNIKNIFITICLASILTMNLHTQPIDETRKIRKANTTFNLMVTVLAKKLNKQYLPTDKINLEINNKEAQEILEYLTNLKNISFKNTNDQTIEFISKNTEPAVNPTNKINKHNNLTNKNSLIQESSTIEINKLELNEYLKDIPFLLTQARVVPYFKGGKAIGLRLFAINNNSFYKKLNLKNGDILKTINKYNFTDLTTTTKILELLKNGNDIEVHLERANKTQILKYKIR